MRVSVLLLLIFPLLEIFLMIKVGQQIGALATVIWLVLAVFVGINILRYQGVSAMRKAVMQMQTNPAGAQPGQAIVDSLVKAIGAILLIIPGFATDLLALVCFISPLRRLLFKRWLGKMVSASAAFTAARGRGSFTGHVYEHQGSTKPVDDAPASGRVLEHEPDKKA